MVLSNGTPNNKNKKINTKNSGLRHVSTKPSAQRRSDQNTKKQLHGQKDPLQHPETVEQKSYENQSTQMEEEAQNTASQNEFYAILDQFTETNDEELAKISHMLIGEDGKPDRRYKCLNCEKSSNFFTQAQRHHLEHKHSELSFVRETLKGVFTEK